MDAPSSLALPMIRALVPDVIDYAPLNWPTEGLMVRVGRSATTPDCDSYLHILLALHLTRARVTLPVCVKDQGQDQADNSATCYRK